MMWNALSAWNPFVSPRSFIGLASFSNFASFGGFVLSAISGIPSPCKMPPVTPSLSVAVIFEGNFFAAFRLQYPSASPFVFLVESIIGEMPFPFPSILGSYPRFLSLLPPCFTSFDIKHLTFAVRVFLAIHSFARNFATIFWENHSFFWILLTPKNLWLMLWSRLFKPV